LRILVGLSDICGYYSQLCEGLRKNGVYCEFLNLYPDRDYQKNLKQTYSSILFEQIQKIARRRIQFERHSLQRYFYILLQILFTPLVFIISILKFDAFIFGCGTTFFPGDLVLLKLFRKNVLLIFHGSDTRPPWCSGLYPCSSEEENQKCFKETKKIKKEVSFWEKNCDKIICHPFSSHFFRRKIISWLAIGIPCPRSTSIIKRRKKHSNRSIKILHAPSRPLLKGTAVIEQAVAGLSKNNRLVLKKITNQQPSAVHKALPLCDFVIDELYSDIPMAGFGAEAASYGKVAIVGMQGFEQLKKIMPPNMSPPFVLCDAKSLSKTIRQLIRTKRYVALGRRAQLFIQKRWAREVVAKRILQILNHQYPKAWEFDPYALTYVAGWGIAAEVLPNRFRSLLHKNSIRSFGVDDKPLLQTEILRIAKTKVL